MLEINFIRKALDASRAERDVDMGDHYIAAVHETELYTIYEYRDGHYESYGRLASFDCSKVATLEELVKRMQGGAIKAIQAFSH
ncbi:hypothetical protein Dxin01_00199 [Deinococcus xinjiangensis]|uniref:Uncharacterized protein n=1 Tax=Deinococcus xinjiangensis TaxID=457454 RepID=A0ABP9V902_9DEIO